MPGTIRFHLDENVGSVIADGLRNRGIDVTTTAESGLIASHDAVQLEFALSQARVIFTQDADFLRLHQAGEDHAGIAYCQQGSRSTFSRREPPGAALTSSIGEILRGLILIWELLEPEDIRGQVEFI